MYIYYNFYYMISLFYNGRAEKLQRQFTQFAILSYRYFFQKAPRVNYSIAVKFFIPVIKIFFQCFFVLK